MVHTLCNRYSILRRNDRGLSKSVSNRSRARHKIVLEILFQQYSLDWPNMFCLSYQYDLKQTKKFSLDFQKYYGSKICQTFFHKCILFGVLLPNTGQSSIHYIYYIFTMPKERSNWIKRYVRYYLYEKKHLLKVFLFIWKFFVTFDPSVVRIVIIFRLYVSDMKLEIFT